MVRPDGVVQSATWDILRDLRGLDPLKELFWSQLNYQRVNEPISRRGWPASTSAGLAASPVLFATGGQDEAFHVIYARLASEKLLRGSERPVISRLLRDHPYALFIFSNETQDHWHFVNVKLGDDPGKRRLFRRITIGPVERLRTASERIAMLDLEAIRDDLSGIAPLDIQNRHDEAFDVEAVTKQFFDEYKAVFNVLWNDLAKQTKDRHWAHDYALQFLNRCMFLYFVQRKGWLGDDPEFLGTFWQAYNDSRQPKGSFFERWLSVLFFQAFNNRFHGGHRQFPDEIRNALQMAPFLNGGLFTENDLDRQDDFNVTDARFGQVFTFLERYNFTIAEDSPLDQEVAVDPEMIGKVYESLVNVPESGADERGEAGIFYTPRTEIDLMCRLALVDNLANNLGDKHKSLFYEAVFALEQQEKEPADTALHKAGLWPKVAEHVRGIKVVDPACGSGSFLVGMLHILDDLQQRAAQHIGGDEDAYDRRKRIIGENLYGVDVMEWACHVAELRLWLSLIIDAEISSEERTIRAEPLLPHFTFKIRCGDSLVQEVGGVNLGHRRGSTDIPQGVKARLTRLQKAKLAYYDSRPLEKFKTISAIKNEEVAVFRDLLNRRVKLLEDEAKGLMRLQGVKAARQRNLLTGEVDGPARQLSLSREQREQQIIAMMEEARRLKEEHAALRHAKDLPLVWDIAFAEVMEGDTDGFDIVIGNPPYVRTRSIADPHLPREAVTVANKKDYKAKLARSVYQAWPRFFKYKRTANSETVGHRIDGKSDLYIYFYFYGLSLLNERGSFCFITSNSWLDVGYGRDLQEFLLRHGHVRMVLDSKTKRSFAAADINTVIVLLAPPNGSRDEGLDRAARFVMFRMPFEEVVSPIIFEEIEDVSDRKATREYRVCLVSQVRLLEQGSEGGDGGAAGEKPRTRRGKRGGRLIRGGKYRGGKWGGAYLRAPDIALALLDQVGGELQPFSEFARVETYLILPKKADQVLVLPTKEVPAALKRFFRPFVRSPRYFQVPWVRESPHAILSCTPVDAAKNSRLREFIRAAERKLSKEYGVPVARKDWYQVDQVPAPILWQRRFGERHLVLYNSELFLSYDFYRVTPTVGADDDAALRVMAVMMSTLFWLFKELFGRANLGEGALKTEGTDLARIPIIDPRQLPPSALEVTKDLLQRPVLPLREELAQEDRRCIDEGVLSRLGLSRAEREAVCEAVADLVESRSKKATSLGRT